jgi:hypothetical protein
MRCGIAFWSKTVTDLGLNNVVTDALILDGFLYLGGYFTEVLGQTRNRLAKVRMSDWTLDAWNPDADMWVSSLATDGSYIYAVGRFTTIGGTSHVYTAKISTDGIVQSWNPNFTFSAYYNGPWDCLIYGSDIWIAGSFYEVAGMERLGLVAVSLATAGLNPIAPKFSGGEGPIVIHQTNDCLACGGLFDKVKKSGGSTWETRHHFALFTLSDGDLDPCDPAPSGTDFWDGAVRGIKGTVTDMVLAGDFVTVYGSSSPHLALVNLDAETIDLTYPTADNDITALATDGVYDYVSGYQTTVGGEPRLGIARIDHSGRTVDAWAPPFLHGPGNTYVILPSADPAMVIFGGGDAAAGIPDYLSFLDPITGLPM